MKRIALYLLLFLSSILFVSCSLKHKWKNKQQQNITHSKNEHLSHLLSSEHLTLDTNSHFSHTQLQNYRLWTLSGNVQIHPNGNLQTDHAILESWHSETDSQQTTSLEITYQNQRVEEETSVNESIDINKRSSYKEKRKFTSNLWWLVLVLILLILGYRWIKK